jgi:serine/threonine protein kinase
MKPPNWDRLQDIYHEALAKPESERSAFVENACAGDPDLLQQIKSLLQANDSTGGILAAPVFEISASDDLVGQTIGKRYLIEKKLDGGGMSQVYVALDLNLQRQQVVIKVLSSELVQDAYARQKFEQEVEALRRIHHQHVVHVLDGGILSDGRPYIVMAYIEGETLRSQISSEQIDLKRAASILKQIGAALSFVHEKGIFHRDLKPENVMLTGGSNSVVLVDFGIAKVKDSLVAPTTVTGVAAGTLAYMSPEQLRGEEITAASDIYSMGVVAYEMIFGERPFDPASTPDLLDLQRKGIGKFPPKVSTTAQHILRRALSFDSKSRYRSAKEFGDKLADALVSRNTGIDFFIVAKAFSGLLILALLSFGVYKYYSKYRPPPTRSFTYFLMVQPVRDGKDYKSPLKSNGEESFNNGDKFQLNVNTPVAAYLYIFNEASPASGNNNFRMIYPNRATNNGAAALGPDQTIQFEWMTFPDMEGTENFWLVCSLTPVPQLESAKTEAFKQPRGDLTDQNLMAVKEFLRTQPLATIYHYKADQTAKPRGKGDTLVALAQFKHR